MRAIPRSRNRILKICHRVGVCSAGVDPADRTGTIGGEAFDATCGAGFQGADDSPHAVECELVEDGGTFVAHRRGPPAPRRLRRRHPTDRGAR